jgi:hypothetical protein
MSASGLTLSVQWRTVLVRDNGEPYYFPDKFTRFFHDSYSLPVVYRWRAMRGQPGDRESIYIGEAEELPRRIQRVRTPPTGAKDSNTNKRLHQIFQNYVRAGRRVVIDLADFEPFEVNGVRFDSDGLGDRFKRRALENLLLAIEQESKEFEILNMVVDPLDKARTALSKLKPHEIREIVKKYGLGGAE